MFYWIKTGRFIKRMFSEYIWEINSPDKTVYLTFDDGPVPVVTPWVMDQLKRFNAKGTFFCIGDNIIENPQIYHEILAQGHATGNHTLNHPNGWKTPTEAYLQNVRGCEMAIANRNGKTTRLFRPPYGKITRSAAARLLGDGYKIIMWDVLSADFDQSISPEKCLKNVLDNVAPGSIIVFHDSEKAFKNLEYALPRTLQFLKDQGYNCEVIT